MHANDSKDIKRGSIVQITQDDNRDSRGMLGIVQTVATWGVVVQLKTPNFPLSNVSLTWSMIDDTGGVALIDASGATIRQPETKMAHHP